MANLLLSLPDLYENYKKWIIKNPKSATEYETYAKVLSYIIAGRINNSNVSSELVYCLSNLLVLFNDQILTKSQQQEQHLNSVKIRSSKTAAEKLRLWLTIVEYSEVFCELSAKKLWGKPGRWIVIVGIQVFKCLARLLLVYEHKEQIIQSPTISPVDRDSISKESALENGLNGQKSTLNLPQNELGAISFTLKRSGKVVRKVESSPPINYRSWKPLAKEETILNTPQNRQALEKPLRGKTLMAETIYVTKPLAHLLSLGLFGEHAWKPYILSLAMDLYSLYLYKSVQSKSIDSLSNRQKLQLSRRTVALLLYLIRSPVYEKYTGSKLNGLLMSMSRNVPLTKIICTPLMQYLPFWQSSYFYMWST